MPTPTPRCLRCGVLLPGALVRFDVMRRSGRKKLTVVGHWCRLCWEIVSGKAPVQSPGEELPGAIAAGLKARGVGVLGKA